ncbi:MAG: alkyl sulfatase dimerization domain-containing protein [Acidobacteriota bacterium]
MAAASRPFLLGVATGLFFATAAVGIGLFAVLRGPSDAASAVVVADSATAAVPDAVAHAAIFERRILEPAPGVHVAIGYGLANVIVVEAPEGLILVDTLESIRAAEALAPWLDGLRRSTGKAVTDVIYTHNHADHVFGAGVLLDGQDSRPRIWAHAATEGRVYEIVNVLAPVTFRRAMRMFGVYLPDGDFVHNGIGPRLLNDHTDGLYFLPPTDTVDDSADVLMAGEPVLVEHAPGETADQLLVFFPERSVLLPADNYYHCFPNLYTVRGTPYRDPRIWARSLDRMRELQAEVLVPSHSAPVVGRELIDHRLRTYRDAIQYVYDETIRGINAGLTPREIAEQIELPPHLAGEPHLQEMYGRVEFAARAVFSGTLGWFSGDPADLRPVDQTREAELLVRLAGGIEGVVAEAERALADGEPAWALTLGGHLDRVADPNAASIRARALRALAADELASSVRNYYLTAAAEAEGFELPASGLGGTPASVLDRIPIRHFLDVLAVHLKDEATLDLEASYGFDFSDSEPMTIRIRRGVALVEPGLAPDRLGTLRTTTSSLRALSTGRATPAQLLAEGHIEVDGGVLGLRKFLAYFAPPG